MSMTSTATLRVDVSAPEPSFQVAGERAHRSPGTPPAGRSHIPFWIAVACLVLVALGLRPGIVSVGPILPGIMGDFALSHRQASLLTAIPTLLMGLLALSTPWLAGHLGRDRVIAGALLLLALATAGRAYSGSTVALFATTVGIGAGIAIVGALIPAFVKASFPGRVAMLMGIYAMALSAGSTIAAGITGALANFLGSWRAPAGLWALPAAFGVLAWLYVERHTRLASGKALAERRPRLPVRNMTAWLAAAFFALNNVIFYSCVSWIAPIYVELGHSTSSAGLILACFTLAFMVATPLFGAISRTDDRRQLLALSAVISFAGVVWIAAAPTVLPFVAVSLVAFGAGGAFTLAMTLPLDNARTDAEATAWNAFVLLVSYLVGAIGPVLVGFLRDSSGNFQTSLWGLVAVGAAMLAVTPFLQPHRHRMAAARKRARVRIRQAGDKQ